MVTAGRIHHRTGGGLPHVPMMLLRTILVLSLYVYLNHHIDVISYPSLCCRRCMRSNGEKSMNTVYTMMPLSRSCPLSNPQKKEKKRKPKSKTNHQ